MPLSPRLKGVLLVLGIIVVLPVASSVVTYSFVRSRSALLERPNFPFTTSSSVSGIESVSNAEFQPSNNAVATDLKGLQEEVSNLRSQVNDLAQLILTPRDKSGRVSLNEDTINLVVNTYPDELLPFAWNTTSTVEYFRPVLIEGERYLLTVPVDPAWGNDYFGVQPYHDTREHLGAYADISFGPLLYSEFFGGGFRGGMFKETVKRSREEALVDPRNASGSDCGDGSELRPASMNDVSTIGIHQVVRAESSGCEGAWIRYEVFGKERNYVFESGPVPNEALLRWTIERFREK